MSDAVLSRPAAKARKKATTVPEADPNLEQGAARQADEEPDWVQQQQQPAGGYKNVEGKCYAGIFCCALPGALLLSSTPDAPRRYRCGRYNVEQSNKSLQQGSVKLVNKAMLHQGHL